MPACFWTLLTGVDTVQAFFDKTAADEAAKDFVQSCDDSRRVTIENWREELAALNKEMDDAGEADYLCTLTEHPLPEFRAVAVLENGEVCRIESASPLLQQLQVAVVETKFSQIDYHPDDVFQVETPHGLISAVGHLQGVQPQNWPIQSVFERISATEPVRAS
jgi:hypothetical protein